MTKGTKVTILGAGMTIDERLEEIRAATRAHHDEALQTSRAALETKLVNMVAARVDRAIDAILGD